MTTKTCPFCYTEVDLDELPIVAATFFTGGVAPSKADQSEVESIGGRDEPSVESYDPQEPPSGLPSSAPPPANVGVTPPTSRAHSRSQRTTPASGAKFFGHVGMYPVLEDPLRPETRQSGGRGSMFGARRPKHSSVDMPTRACRKCELLLPDKLSSLDVITIGVVGTMNAGKSHYLTAAGHQLMRRQRLKQLNAGTVKGVGTVAADFHTTRYNLVYRKKKAHERTEIQAGVEAFSKPLALHFAATTGRQSMLLFHDVPGEMLVDPAAMRLHFPFLAHLQGLIVMVDPLSIPAVIDQLPGVDDKHFHDADNIQDYMLDKLVEVVGESTCATLPTSVAISKSDMIQRAFGPIPALDRPEPNDPQQLIREMNEIHNIVVHEVLPKLDDPALETSLESFRNRAYHLVAAIGSLPDADGNIGALVPSRVIDPVFNLLHQIS